MWVMLTPFKKTLKGKYLMEQETKRALIRGDTFRPCVPGNLGMWFFAFWGMYILSFSNKWLDQYLASCQVDGSRGTG